MTTHSCDICGTNLKPETIQIGVWLAPRVELCKACAAPIIAFLTKHDLLQEQLERYGFVEKVRQTSGVESL